MKRLALVAVLLGACTAGKGRVRPNPALRQALIAHGESDQGIRDTLVQILQSGGVLDSTFRMRMVRLDSTNTEWLKGVLASTGWPRRSEVGDTAAEAAFLIVQHAVQDTAFMARALGLMEPLVADSEVKGSFVAMLADRLQVKRSGRQRYGTQAQLINGRMVLDPIDDSVHVDERRAAVGMPPLAQYVAVLESLYTARPKP